MEPIQKIAIGGTNVDWEGMIDSSYRTTAYALGRYPVYIGDQKPSKDSDVTVQFRTGHAYPRATSRHCLFDMSECWTVRTHPSITSISKSQGYIAGGQVLSISGAGLKGTGNDVQVSIAGVPCEVLSVDSDLITCRTGEAAEISAIGTQPSTPGLREIIYDPTNSNSNVNIGSL
jgi:hypothetical protein